MKLMQEHFPELGAVVGFATADAILAPYAGWSKPAAPPVVELQLRSDGALHPAEATADLLQEISRLERGSSTCPALSDAVADLGLGRLGPNTEPSPAETADRSSTPRNWLTAGLAAGLLNRAPSSLNEAEWDGAAAMTVSVLTRLMADSEGGPLTARRCAAAIEPFTEGAEQRVLVERLKATIGTPTAPATTRHLQGLPRTAVVIGCAVNASTLASTHDVIAWSARLTDLAVPVGTLAAAWVELRSGQPGPRFTERLRS